MQESDKEFYGEFLKVREKLMSDGWTQGELNRERDMIEATFHKNGYSTHIMFGCAEKIKQEVL
jgi:hypothetical protein